MAKERVDYSFARRLSGMGVSAIREILKVAERPEVISFAGGLPAPEVFPVAALAHTEVFGALVRARQAADLHTNTIRQRAAARLLAGFDFDAHVERIEAVYGARRDAMLAALAEHFWRGVMDESNRPVGVPRRARVGRARRCQP